MKLSEWFSADEVRLPNKTVLRFILFVPMGKFKLSLLVATTAAALHFGVYCLSLRFMYNWLSLVYFWVKEALEKEIQDYSKFETMK